MAGAEGLSDSFASVVRVQANSKVNFHRSQAIILYPISSESEFSLPYWPLFGWPLLAKILDAGQIRAGQFSFAVRV